MTAFVLMGVSGAGKSTVGRRVAQELHLPFLEGDDCHPRANIEKMSTGIPLSSFVRNRLREMVREPVEFILLTADPSVIQQRLRERPQHYMKAGMLGSQLAALNVPSEALQVDVARPLRVVTDEVAAYIRERLSPARG